MSKKGADDKSQLEDRTEQEINAMSEEALRSLESSYDKDLKNLIIHKKSFITSKDDQSKFFLIKNLAKSEILSTSLLKNLNRNTDKSVESHIADLQDDQKSNEILDRSPTILSK
jgi:hypothetical protein